MAEMVAMFIKFFGLLIINLLVIAAIRRAAIRRQHLLVTGKQRAAQNAGEERRSRNSNYLLLGSAGLYLFSTLPSLVYKILIIAETNHSYNFDKSAKSFATPFCQTFFSVNYSINFFLYLTVSERYRVQFIRLFAGVFCPEGLRRHVYKYRDSSRICAASVRNPQAAADKPQLIRMKAVGAVEDEDRNRCELDVLRRAQSEMTRNYRESEST
ncbi:uncharacterized protein LOC129592666 [Paramacrobiotus metropolitanus]|uniref:uncharacterized protein LOC129592666 n=1 Tax=Paramacrobiotus metropolitanus TaxID=2943436 RepID=UPI0024460EF1|nr:uncharacterized protein LOC129592666 [Paramacrobiotus metropolitanus]